MRKPLALLGVMVFTSASGQDYFLNPRQARRDEVEGTVYISFVIGTDGKVKDVEMLRGVRDDLNQAT